MFFRMPPIKKFWRNEDGSATIEAVLWLPLFVVFFVMVADVSFVFHRQAQMLRVVQDANRAFSVGRLSDEDATESFITTALLEVSDSAVATTSIGSGIITSTLRVPVGDLVAVGFFAFLSGYDIEVESQHFLEY